MNVSGGLATSYLASAFCASSLVEFEEELLTLAATADVDDYPQATAEVRDYPRAVAIVDDYALAGAQVQDS